MERGRREDIAAMELSDLPRRPSAACGVAVKSRLAWKGDDTDILAGGLEYRHAIGTRFFSQIGGPRGWVSVDWPHYRRAHHIHGFVVGRTCATTPARRAFSRVNEPQTVCLQLGNQILLLSYPGRSAVHTLNKWKQFQILLPKKAVEFSGVAGKFCCHSPHRSQISRDL